MPPRQSKEAVIVTGEFRVSKGAMPQDAKTPDCHIAMCVLILSAFSVSAQFGPLQLYSLDPPVLVVLCSREGNRRHGIAPAMHYKLWHISTYGFSGLGTENRD